MFLKDRLNITTEREYTDEGFLKVPARISRVGIQTYLATEMGLTDREPNSIIRVFRPEEEVFSGKSLTSFASKPITDNHPPELITSKNAKEFSVGHAGPEVIKDGIFAKTFIQVTDADAIAKIESGKVELSNGYTADIDWTPGVSPDGENFDAVQRNIKGNHIAIVERGRAGPACRLADNLTTNGDEVIMPKITIDGVDYEVSEQAVQAVNKLQANLRDAEEKTLTEAEKVKAKEDEMEEKAKAAEKTEDSLKAQLDEANSKVPSAESLDKLVADRKEVVDSVLKVCPEMQWEGKDATTLRKEVVLAKCQISQMDSVSNDYIQARFDMLLESVNTNSQHNLDQSFSKEVNDTGKEVVDNRPLDIIAREKMMIDSQNRWKGEKS